MGFAIELTSLLKSLLKTWKKTKSSPKERKLIPVQDLLLQEESSSIQSLKEQESDENPFKLTHVILSTELVRALFDIAQERESKESNQFVRFSSVKDMHWWSKNSDLVWS